jgi:hypothetical protein
MDNTRENLINLLSKCLPKNITILSYDDNFTVNIKQGNIADYLIANSVTLDNQVSSSKWISVNDRLPDLHTVDYEYFDGSRTHFEISCDQWVINKDYYQTKARYENGVVFQGWVGELGETIQNVTHWMPLPQPPKGE